MNKFEPIYFAPEKKVTGGWLVNKSSPSPPPAPDYTGAATATAAGNKEAAQATAAANRVNQYGPNGSMVYSSAGNDTTGNPTYNLTTTLSHEQQQIQNQQNSLNSGLLNTAQGGLGYANDVLSHPGVDQSQLTQPGQMGNAYTPNLTDLNSNLPTTGYNPGQSYQDAMMSRLQPQIQRENEQSDTKLANQGIMQGSEAYKNAQTALSQQHNDLLNNATVQGLQAGLQANQQQFGQNQAQNQQDLSTQNQLFNQTNANYAQGLGANQQQFQQAAYNQMQPINVINALRSGTQVSSPTLNNVPAQANVAGPDLLGAAQGNYNAAMGQYNAAQQSNNSMMGGLMGLGGSLGSAGIIAY